MILVDIYVPALDEVYDFQIDETVPIGSVVIEIAEMLANKSKTKHDRNMKDLLLCSKENSEIFDKSRSLKSYGVRNGHSLILV